MDRSTRLVILIKNKYTLWDRKCFLLPVTYFSSNLKYPFTLRVTVIVNTGISLLNHFLILVMVAFYLYTVKRTKLLNTQRIRVVSALRERKLGECSRNEFGEYKEREFWEYEERQFREYGEREFKEKKRRETTERDKQLEEQDRKSAPACRELRNNGRRLTLNPSVVPCAEGNRSNGKSADLEPWCGAVRRGRKWNAED